jgi:hypothetical protein
MRAIILGLVLALTMTTAAVAAPPAATTAATSTGVLVYDEDDLYREVDCDPIGWCFQGWFYIVNRGTGRCLDAHSSYGGGNGNPVGLFDCNGGVTEWWAVASRIYRSDYTFRISNGRNGRCLDYPASSGGADGWQYTIWDCLGTTGQWFRISDWNSTVGGRLLTVELAGITVGPNHHVDAFQVDGGGNGNRVGNYVWTGHPLQHWYFKIAR